MQRVRQGTDRESGEASKRIRRERGGYDRVRVPSSLLPP